jgi:protein TonB
MFELISEKRRRSPHGDALPIAISTAAHLLVLSVLVVVPLLYVTDQLPETPAIMAFVTPAPPPPPAPPLPPPPPTLARTPAAPRPVPTAGTFAAPIEVPTRIEAEAGIDYGVEGGVPGGVEGGVPGGVPGGIVGGLPSDIPPPPPPPPPVAPPAPRAPVRIGGELQAPALLRRVEPVYPDIAVRADVEGMVILEATVDRDGRIEDLRVLRSMPLLDRAALEAVRQWQYSPLLLNGKPERFVLTVVVSFRLSNQNGG